MRSKLSLPSPTCLLRTLARYAACARGVTAVEFAFVAPMIIALILGAFQISTLYVAQAYLDTVTEKAMRIVLTNQSYTLTASQFQTQLCASVNAMFDCNSIIVVSAERQRLQRDGLRAVHVLQQVPGEFRRGRQADIDVRLHVRRRRRQDAACSSCISGRF